MAEERADGMAEEMTANGKTLRKMITEAVCDDCKEMFNPDDECFNSEGKVEHYECGGFNTRITGSWFQDFDALCTNA